MSNSLLAGASSLQILETSFPAHCFLPLARKCPARSSLLIRHGEIPLITLKPVTIPRMELSAAVLSTRLDRMIHQEINLSSNNSFYWTDSTCVLR